MVRVILGMPGPWANDNCEASDHYTTKIGGLPDWPLPESDIRPDLLECGECGKRLCLVAQVYAPNTRDTSKIEERIIYVLGCVMPKGGSCPFRWRVLRVQKPPSNVVEVISATEEVPSLEASSESTLRSNWWGDDLWTQSDQDEDDDSNDADVDLEELGRALSEATSLASHSKKKNGRTYPEDIANGLQIKPSTKVKDASIPVVPCFYIYSQEEPSSGNISAICASYSSISVKENKSHTDDSGGEEAWDEEGYEYDRALDADRTYLKFKKQVDAFPEQCFRYGGKPLLATTDLGEPGTCGLCGGSRDYEMQLMSPLLYFLREAAVGSSTCSPEDWNWITLLVYTCSKSCSLPSPEDKSGNDGWTVVEEAALIQNDSSSSNSARLAYFA